MRWWFGRRAAGPEAAHQLRDKASRLSAQGRHGAAADALRALAALEPANGMHLVRLANAYRRIGQRDRAASVLLRAAEAFLHEDRLDRAVACCHAAVDLCPGNETAGLLLQTVQARRRRLAGVAENALRNLHPPMGTPRPEPVPPPPAPGFDASEWAFADEETLADAAELAVESTREAALRMAWGGPPVDSA